MHRRFYDKKISFIQVLDDLKLTKEAYDKAHPAADSRSDGSRRKKPKKDEAETGKSKNNISSCLSRLIGKIKTNPSTRKRITSNRIGFYLTALDQLLGACRGVKEANMIKEYEDLLLVHTGKLKTASLSSCLERYIEKIRSDPDLLFNRDLREQIFFEQILYFLYNFKDIFIKRGIIKPWEQVVEYEEVISLYISQIFCKILRENKGIHVCQHAFDEVSALKAENESLKEKLKL